MTWFYSHFAAFLAIGARNREFYSAHGASDAQLHLVPYAVDNAFFIDQSNYYHKERCTLRNKFQIPLEQPVILFASKLIPRKRPIDLLRAFQIVRKRISATLVFVGSGNEEAALKHLVFTESITDVLFLGFQNQTALPQFFAIADIFVLPSENEPWGLVINEAMCAGLPIVASADIGAVPDLVRHGETGFIFRCGDIEQLTECLEQLITDRVRRQQMGLAGRALIQRWDFEHCVQGVRTALNFVCQKNHI
jgi:glycosyltransferase involved in cell wall biosynthesis